MALGGIEDAVKAVDVEDVLKDVSQLKATVTAAVEEGVKSALRAVKQGRRQAEDALDDAKQAVNRNPIEAVGIAFLTGLLVGGLASWIASRSLQD